MKKINKLAYLFILAFLTLYATSCLKDDDSEMRKKEKKLIENYVTVSNITVSPTSSGLYYIPITEGTGPTPTDKDFAIIQYKVTDLEGKFFDGTDKALVEQNKVYPYFVLGGPLKIFAGPQGFNPGILEALKLMREGGKAKLIMPSILAYNDYVPRIIELELLKVVYDPLAYEKEQIANYLDTASNLSPDNMTAGIYFIKRKSGTGTTKATATKGVKIRYKGSLLDGRVFDNTEDSTYTFTVGSEPKEVIQGLDMGIREMVEGDSATLVIPYTEGYGLDQRLQFNRQIGKYQVVIPYFSTLVFQVKLVDIIE